MDLFLVIACFYVSYTCFKETVFAVTFKEWIPSMWIEFVVGIVLLVIGTIRALRYFKNKNNSSQTKDDKNSFGGSSDI